MRDATPQSAGYFIGVDVGGTFTDVVLTSGTEILRAKAPTTPIDLVEGVLSACRLVAKRAGLPLEEVLPHVRRFGLGTTAVTNVLTSRTGRRLGLITTRGFEDTVPTARGRYESRDGWLVKPPQIIDRLCIVGINERIDRHGEVLQSLDLNEVVEAGRWLIEERKVEAVAVSFLSSYVNPKHEQMAAHALVESHPDLPVVSGAELLPVMREYERTTFALLNAYVSGAVRGIDNLEGELRRLGLDVPLLLVHSGGGSITVQEARGVPILLAKSGPAAGVAAAALVARETNFPHAVACDMGGTTFDVAVISDGRPGRRSRGDLMGVWTAVSSVDVDSLGAGGGSIAWIDALGALNVGPRSAGASPGPACYGLGGIEPTVTDALLVLGYLHENRFLGGQMPLDSEAAETACARIGNRIGLSVDEVAWGIREVALAQMTTAVRAQLAQRGMDPRKQAILSHGACAGLFTASFALAIGARAVIVPELASVLSAFGAATADVRRERQQSLGLEMPADVEVVRQVMHSLHKAVDQDLANDGIEETDRKVSFEADLLFKRQKWELSIPVQEEAFEHLAVPQLLRDFHAEYVKRYGEGSFMAGSTIVLTGLRAIGVGYTAKASFNRFRDDTIADGTPIPIRGTRPVRTERNVAPGPVHVVLGSDLAAGHFGRGPMIIDGSDTTVWIPPGVRVRVDKFRNLVMETSK